jgi:hypothetical protein
MYKLQKQMPTDVDSVLRVSDNACIPFDERNTDYQAYLKWLDGYELIENEWVQTNPDGNTPLPADSE